MDEVALLLSLFKRLADRPRVLSFQVFSFFLMLFMP